MSTPLYAISDITAVIGGRRLYSIDSFDLHAGRCVLLRGENGVGKSTLLKSIAGLSVLDCESVAFYGRIIDSREYATHLRAHTVYLHQQPYLFDCSVYDNIAYGLKRSGYRGDKLRERIERGLEWSGLQRLKTRNSRELSGGERQRVALVRAYVLQPEVILLDEPTAGMDKDSRRQAMTLISNLRDDGMSVVVTSHEQFNDMGFADEALLLHDGALRQQPVD